MFRPHISSLLRGATEVRRAKVWPGTREFGREVKNCSIFSVKVILIPAPHPYMNIELIGKDDFGRSGVDMFFAILI
uniref:WGS project CBMG000000000 data, contig CS5907-c002497 n=1 Tax=Fusarium acuminatum CS5907 TaxID=1318461 RepID=A0A090M9K9_9HYPO|nr:unnamed protein product [Fusarium acuminatum CS5907]